MFKQIQFFTFLLLLFTLMSCDDEVPDDPNKPPELPPLTMEGKNTLGCKINGKNWVASVGFNLSGDQAFQMGYDSVSGHFGINALWKTTDKSIFERLGFESFISDNIIGRYSIARDSRSPDFIDIDNRFKAYWLEPKLSNNVNIIFFNKFKKIISGTFEFTAIDTVNADTLIITEGRFDSKY